MRYGFIFAAPFLLFNPAYAIIDPLPDFLGYALICIALSRLRDVNSYFEASSRAFTRLALVELLKLPVALSIFSWIALAERSTMLLLAAFCFAVGELILMTTAWRSFFEGLTVFSEISDGSVALRGNMTKRIMRATLVFFYLREILIVLPELSVLSSQGYDESAFDFSQFTSLFRVLAYFVIIIIGIVWLVRIVRYLAVIGKDHALFESAKQVYEETVINKPGVGIRREIRSALAVIAAFMLLSADLTIDGMNVIPDTLAFIVAAVAFVMLRKYSKLWRAGVIVSVLSSGTAAAGWYLSYRFHIEHGDLEVQKTTTAFAAFWRFYPFIIATAVLTFVVILLFVLAVKSIATSHCGYISENSSSEYIEAKLSEIRKNLCIRLYVIAFFGLLSAVSGIVYPWIITFKGLMIGEMWWAIDLILALGVFFSGLSAFSAINSEAESRYMLE